MRGPCSRRRRVFTREVSESADPFAILEREAGGWNPVDNWRWNPDWHIFRERDPRYRATVRLSLTPTPEPEPIRTVKKPFRLRAARRANARRALANADKSLSTRARRYPVGRYQLRPRNT